MTVQFSLQNLAINIVFTQKIEVLILCVIQQMNMNREIKSKIFHE